jgi:hypothetical protein
MPRVVSQAKSWVLPYWVYSGVVKSAWGTAGGVTLSTTPGSRAITCLRNRSNAPRAGGSPMSRRNSESVCQRSLPTPSGTVL